MWIEDDALTEDAVSTRAADLAFRLAGGSLPVEHAHALRAAVAAVLDWLPGEAGAGIHAIHVASSGNGWQRPEAGGDEPLRLSRRTRLVLRLPVARLADARRLEGRTLDVAGHPLSVGEAKPRELRASATLFARYVAQEPGEDEPAFVARAMAALAARGIGVRKLLCGQAWPLAGDEGVVHTRSLMLADLAPRDSLALQEEGLGAERTLGCGLFVPHKSIAPVRGGDE